MPFASQFVSLVLTFFFARLTDAEITVFNLLCLFQPENLAQQNRCQKSIGCPVFLTFSQHLKDRTNFRSTMIYSTTVFCEQFASEIACRSASNVYL